MPTTWTKNDGIFHLGINMAGAVSAGAYTAGVLDFLTEALEQWYVAKAMANPTVPMHDVSIDVFSGASAGGMCAAISAAMLQGSFEHIRNPADEKVTGTTNRFYESWVNKIDIEPLLGTKDLANGGPVVSLLDSSIINDIAEYALAPIAPQWPAYLSPSLTLFLTLTNVRGVPFRLVSDEGSAEEHVAYYADRVQFEMVQGANKPTSKSAKPLPVGLNAGAWPLLKDAAKATGAFPIFLAPRKIDRSARDYMYSPWESMAIDPLNPFPPAWTLHEDDTFTTLNVDGGVTDNDPFELAHDFLVANNPCKVRDPETGELHNPPQSNAANCAVLTVAPFPSYAAYDEKYNFDTQGTVAGMLPNLFTALISQSRFQGETLTAVLSKNSFSRFVLAPSDPDTQEAALQCSLLSAFGGFFERGFRAHDYQLGRRNCQKFLRDWFRLSIDNDIMKAGLDRLDLAAREAVMKTYDAKGSRTLPIIPWFGTAVPEVLPPDRATITSARVGHIVNWVVDRLHAVAKPLIEEVLGKEHTYENFAARTAADALISTWGRAKLREVLQEKLKGSIKD